MGKAKSLIALIILFICACDKEHEVKQATIELPVVFQDGFGPFGWNYGILRPLYSKDDPEKAPWNKMYARLTGVPTNWTARTISNVWLEPRQLLYQQRILGNVDSILYQKLQRSWNWTPDKSRLSQVPIRSEVYVASGINKFGKASVIIDTDNDLDFSDEVQFYPKKGTRDSLRFYQGTHFVEYDLYVNGKIETRKIKMAIVYLPDESRGQKFWFSFPRYAVANLILNGKQHKIAINTGFSSPWAEFSELAVLERLGPREIVKIGQGIEKGSNFELLGNRIKNLGFDIRTNLLQLQIKIDNDSVHTPQTQTFFQDFTANDFLSGKQISSSDYKGKYLFIDFWGTWCAPCVAELPMLKAIHHKVKESRVQFVGIVGNDNPAHLRKFLNKSSIPWPQILSDNNNKFIERYNIVIYPSTMLIDPDGRIIAKNIRAKDLEEFLQSHNCLLK
jgi:peroxiredoxin